jgi:C4-dicarboxylate-specific signal transduction histidine kinase
MKQVFTRWPGEPTLARPNDGPVSDLPQWSTSKKTFHAGYSEVVWFRFLVCASLAPALCVAFLPFVLRGAALFLAALILVITSAVLVLLALQYRNKVAVLRRDLAESEAWADILFNRSGISLWREDWSAARDAIAALLAAGITDVQHHFTENPQAMRDLRKRVQIKDVNLFAVEMMGARSKSDLVGTLDNILPDTDHTFMQWLVAFARGDRYYRSETHIVRPDGSAVDTLFTAEIPDTAEGFENIVVSALDITGFKATQAQFSAIERDMLRASRITTMGALSASIAHEVNSPLAAIKSNAEASLRWLERPQPDMQEAKTAIRNVIDDATRARNVVERTRAYLGNAPAQEQLIDLVEVARSAILLVERELRDSEVSVHFDGDENIPLIKADPIQIQQVLVNLMLNGAQAMAAKPAPRDLTVTIRSNSEEVCATVQDKGSGIDPAQADRIFEPFYSNRLGGMGMGLAICRTVVEALGGRIWMSSQPDLGSTFRFALPVRQDSCL